MKKKLRLTQVSTRYYVEDLVTGWNGATTLEKAITYIQTKELIEEEINHQFKKEVMEDLIINGMKSNYILKNS